MAIIEVSIIPLGTGTTSMSKHVSRAIDVLESQKEVRYQLTPMGTIVEGDLDKAWSIVRQMHECGFDDSVQRVLTTITIDDRRDKISTMEDKVRSVQSKLR